MSRRSVFFHDLDFKFKLIVLMKYILWYSLTTFIDPLFSFIPYKIKSSIISLKRKKKLRIWILIFIDSIFSNCQYPFITGNFFYKIKTVLNTIHILSLFEFVNIGQFD